jgi:polysaccharide biosynthesis transport protein
MNENPLDRIDPRPEPARQVDLLRTALPTFSSEAAANHGQTPTFGISDLLLVLRRWWWKCTLVGVVLAAATGAVVWATFTPVYEAIAWLEIKARPTFIAFEQTDTSGAFAETQLQTIKSPVVLTQVAADPEIGGSVESSAYATTLDWLKKTMKAGYVGRSELCEISFRSSNASLAARVANAVMDAYLSLHTANTSESTKRVVELLKDEKTRRAEDVRKAQDRVRHLTKSATEDDPNLLHHNENIILQQSPLSGLEERRTAAEVERAVLEAKLKAYEETAAPEQLELPAGDLAMAIDQNQEIKALKLQAGMLRSRLREHRRRSVDPNDTSATRMTREIEQLDQSVQKAMEELRPRLEDELRSQLFAKRLQHASELKANIANQKMLEDLWQKRITDQRQKVERLGDKSVDLDFARAELERAQEVFSRISDRIVVLQTEMSAPSRATPLKRAEPPVRPQEIVPLKRMGLGCMGAFCLPFALALAWERWSRRIYDPHQLAHEFNLPVLGELCFLDTPATSGDRVTDRRYLRDRMTYEESIDSLRLALMLTPHLRDVQTIVVASAISREGKTSLASALSLSLAKSTCEPILLIDADMRCPSLHEIFNVDLGPGLADVLAGKAAVRDTILDVARLPIHLLPAGQLKTSPHTILRRGEFCALLNELRKTYRYVVVDGPPVLAAAEAMILASAADGTIVCTMRDISRGPQFRLACQRLQAAGANLLGSVISGLPTRVWAYKYGGYGYGWKRYAKIQEQLALEADHAERQRDSEGEKDP